MKVAIIHYWFITRRGGEKVVETLLKLYPNADIYTLFYDENKYGDYLNGHRVYTSKYNTPFFRKHYQKLFPLYPMVLKSLRLRDDYDLIISSESGPAKGIEIKNNAKHVCYIHSPMRYCWGFTNEYLESINIFLRPLAKYFFGEILRIVKLTQKNKLLGISSDSIIDYFVYFKKEVNGNIHLDYLQKNNSRSWKISGLNSEINFDYYNNKLIFKKNNKVKIYSFKNFNRNNLFLDEIKFFMSHVRKNKKISCNIQESYKLLNDFNLLI